MKRSLRLVGCLTAVASIPALPGPAHANANTNAAAQGTAYPEIVVTGESDGYLAIDTVTATKIDTPLLDTPQTVNVITADQIADQAHHSMEDVLRYVPGVTVGQGEGNRDQITLRGQNTTADFFLDGVRDDVQYYRNLYNIERVEILKGPYALIFGRGGGGGIVNRVQKAPSVEKTFGQVAGSVNTFGAWETHGDVNLPVSDTAAVRLNALYEELASNRDYYDGRRFAVNPTFGADLGGNWVTTLSYEYVDDDRVTDRGVVSDGDRPIAGQRDTFFGVPGFNRTGIKAHIGKVRLDGEIANGLHSTTTVLYGNYDKFYTNVFGRSAPDAITNEVTLGSYSSLTDRENVIAQTNLVADFATGGLEHKVLVGVEYAHQQSDNLRYGADLSSDVIDLDAIVYPTATLGDVTRETESTVTALSAYAQDQLSLSDMFDVVFGLRYDRFKIEGDDIYNDFPFDRTDEKVSPRLGLIFKPVETASIYASFSRSFLPRSGDQFASLSATTANLDPTMFENFEIGAKWEPAPGLMLAAAAFQLDRTNTTTPDPEDPTQNINVGKTRTEGVEIGLVGEVIEGWQVSAAYTYQDGSISGLPDRDIAHVPHHQASLWNRYDFNPAVGVGLGVVHQSSQYASISNAVKLPSFTRVDAAFFYTLDDRIELQVNIENLLDETYFASAHNDNNIMPGAPINARLSARVKF